MNLTGSKNEPEHDNIGVNCRVVFFYIFISYKHVYCILVEKCYIKHQTANQSVNKNDSFNILTDKCYAILCAKRFLFIDAIE